MSVEKQKEQEAKLVEKLQAKLDAMLEVEGGKKLFGGCKHAHLTEMVKVAHQVRSLVGE